MNAWAYFAKLLDRASTLAQLDVQQDLEKLVAHGAFGGMAALTRLPLGPMLACQETRAMLLDVMLEIVAVGCARGVPIPTDCVDRIMAMAHGLPPGARPSLLEDLASTTELSVVFQE